MSDDQIDGFVALAEAAAAASGAVLRRYFRTRLAVDDKEDATPVTRADREAEEALRGVIVAGAPDHGIFGEEYGTTDAASPYVWVLDPIDGTRAFVAGKPMWGTLIALVRDGTPLIGMIDQPVSGERWVGVTGRATRFDGAEAKVSGTTDLAAATLNTTSPTLFDVAERAAFERLSGRVRETQYGGDCYAYGLLAAGFLDLVVECGLKPYDYCALVPIITGAGGVVTDWQGRDLTIGSDGRVIAAASAPLHKAALEILAGGAG
jgi:inositol-phosphate phosphatase/L-galactose 1-phosphate phosphatase/histidinol-phosphatase